MFRTLLLIIAASFCMTIAGCGVSPQYQDHVSIPKNAWDYNFKPEFKFTIKDTAAAYHLFFLIRHTDAYPFNNIWISMDTKGPGDTAFTKMRREITLSTPDGRWLGRGMGELYETRAEINTVNDPAKFSKPGEYTIRLAHEMRKNPLPEIMQVGLKLENMTMNNPQH